MKLAPFVTLRVALSILRLAGAELAEVLGGARHDICKELHLEKYNMVRIFICELCQIGVP